MRSRQRLRKRSDTLRADHRDIFSLHAHRHTQCFVYCLRLEALAGPFQVALATADSGLLRMALAVGLAQVERTVGKIFGPATTQSGHFSWAVIRNNFSFIFRGILGL